MRARTRVEKYATRESTKLSTKRASTAINRQQSLSVIERRVIKTRNKNIPGLQNSQTHLCVLHTFPSVHYFSS